jgi:hypothetical protein
VWQNQSSKPTNTVKPLWRFAITDPRESELDAMQTAGETTDRAADDAQPATSIEPRSSGDAVVKFSPSSLPDAASKSRRTTNSWPATGTVTVSRTDPGTQSPVRPLDREWPLINGYEILGILGRGGMGRVLHRIAQQRAR